MERLYETVCIVRSDAGDDVVKGVIKKATAAVEGGGGKLNKVDEWGRRRLAYPINKRNEGYYFVLTYTSSTDTSRELGRQLRLSEDVIRHQTVQLDPKTQLEKPAEAAPSAPAEVKGGENGGKE